MSITVTTNETEQPAVQQATTSNDVSGEESVSAQAEESEANSEALEEVESDSEEESEEESEQGSEDSEEEESEDEDEDGEEEEDDEDNGEEEDDSDKPKRKKPSGFKKRIDKLNKRVSARDELIEAQKRELEYLRKLAEKAEGKESPEPEVQKAGGNVDDYGLKKPDINDYEEYNDYVEDLTEYKVQLASAKKEAEAKQRAEQEAQKKQVESFKSKLESFASEVEDFAEVIQDVDDIVAVPVLQQAIVESDFGPQLMYELAQNPEEFRRINQLGKEGIYRALGRMEAKIELKSSGSETKPKPKKKSKAPRPLEKVGAKGSGTVKDLSDPNLSQREFERLRAEQLKNKRAY